MSPRLPAAPNCALPLTALVLLGLLALAPPARGAQEDDDEGPFGALEWRCIGPFRGGRVTAVAGIRGQVGTYYLGAAGGGVWRTVNAGASWKNLTDGQLGTGTIGAIAVAPSDANVIYVGTGEGPIRAVTTANGDGLYRSTDRGETWTRVGLERSRHIPAVRVHPDDPDVVWVAAQGSPWGPGPDRGVYKSTDGGANWTHTLFVDEDTGACDLALDVTNPRILYAATWDHRRSPWQVRSGGPGSGIHRSTDGGLTWTRLAKGLPETMGKIGVAVSPADPRRVWAIVEADDGGLFRSDDGGESWRLVNPARVLRARSWYYMHVCADPVDRETVYVLNSPMMKSVDGGATFTLVKTPHVDNHALWIDPEDPRVMVNGNDGGANVSLDGGATWSTQLNQPTAQFYRVITDNAFPYRVYGGQQDNSTVCIASRTFEGGIGRGDWESIGGGESAHVAFDPDAPTLVYATTILGWITEFDRRTRMARNVQAYPQFGLGTDARDYRYRFNWNAPVHVSLHDPSVIYHGGNVLLKSTDRGRSWIEASPDLTRNEPDKQGRGGVPFTNEAAGAEVYGTIFYLAESPHEAGVLWAGSDDGLVHLTRDGGTTWTAVTPPGVGEAQINTIAVSPHDPATACVAVTRYKLDDFAPLAWRTTDYGRSWTGIADGLPEGSFVRVVREDPVRPGLLFAGTETGVHVSFDAGGAWQPFQLGLPVVPITDLRVHEDDLVVATQGRAFWILDDLSPVRQWSDDAASAPFHLFQPADALRLGRADGYVAKPGKNPPGGAILDFTIAAAPDPAETLVRLEILDAAGLPVRTFSNREHPAAACYAANREPHAEPGKPYGLLKLEDGLNRFVWDLRRENVPCVPGHLIPSGWQGPRVAPGEYLVRLTVGEESTERTLRVLPDPRTSVPAEAFAAHARTVTSIYEAIGDVHHAIVRARTIRDQVGDRVELTSAHPAADEIAAAAGAVQAVLESWDDDVITSERETQQDVANFENQLSMELSYLMGQVDAGDPPVNEGARERLADLTGRWAVSRAELRRLIEDDVRRLNDLLRGYGVPEVYLPGE